MTSRKTFSRGHGRNRHEGPVLAQGFRPRHQLFFHHHRDGAGAAHHRAFPDEFTGTEGGENEVPQLIEAKEEFLIHLQHAVFVRHQVDPALARVRERQSGSRGRPGQPFGGVFLVELIRRQFHDVEVGLAHVQQPRHVLLGDEMPAPEPRTLVAAGYDLRDVVGQPRAHRFFNWNDLEH